MTIKKMVMKTATGGKKIKVGRRKRVKNKAKYFSDIEP